MDLCKLMKIQGRCNVENPKTGQSAQLEGVPQFLAKLGVKKTEWQYAVKKDWRLLMRPGWDLRVKVYACLQMFTRGYPGGGGEFAMMQVGREDKEEKRPKFVPISPTIISTKLFQVAREEYNRSEKPLRDDELKKMRVRPQHMRRILESIETDDGVVTSVTVAKYLSADATVRKLGDKDLQRLMTEGLSFKDARAQKLIVPIHELSRRDRKRLAGRSFLYVHVDHRPATVAALMRRTEDDLAVASRKTESLHTEPGTPVQLLLRLMRAEGIQDPEFAAELAARPDISAYIDDIQTAEGRIASAREGLRSVEASAKAFLRPLIEAHKQNSVTQDSTVLNPLGKEPNSSAGTPSRRAVDTPSVALNPNTQKRVARSPEPFNQQTSERRATEKPSTMGRNTGRVDPRQAPAGASAPPKTSSEGRQAGSPSSPERDRASRSAPLNSPDEPLVSQPRKAKTVDEPLAAEFHEALSLRFHDVGGRVPTRKQTDPILQALGANVERFLQWLSPTEMQRRKPQHGGLLPFLLEEFEALVSTAERKPIQIEESSRDMLLRLRGFDSTGRKVQNG
jgi:hypothetical protein